MSPAQMTLEFSKLSHDGKARFLCRLGTRLTAISRELYADRTPVADAAHRLRGFNEIYHKVFGQLGHIVAKSHQGYPAEAFVASLSALAAESGLSEGFSNAWALAMPHSGRSMRPGNHDGGRPGARRSA